MQENGNENDKDIVDNQLDNEQNGQNSQQSDVPDEMDFDMADIIKTDAEPEEMSDQTELEKYGGRRRKSSGFELFDWADALVTSLIFIVLLISFVMKLTIVDGPSMMPTLIDGERLIISNILFKPQVGDIVVISKKSFSEDPIVKRIIALEGQEVDINAVEHTVSVDNQILKEEYINDLTRTLYDVEFPCVVPPNCVFVMGDNRNESLDSRDKRIGFVDKREILGKVLIRIYPFTKIGSIK